MANLLSVDVLNIANELRTIAVVIILMKAGLSLDREKLAKQSTVALRLGFLPAIGEVLIIAIAAMLIFDFDVLTGLLLGCVIGAESPAVIVPEMLRLKTLGLGVAKGIPDAILTGSILSDVLLLLVFNLLMSLLGKEYIQSITLPGGLTFTVIQLLPLQIILQILLGLVFSYFATLLLVYILAKPNLTQNVVKEILFTICSSLLMVNCSQYFSGYLATMSMGFFLTELNAPLARRLRDGFKSLWIVAEIILFVLMGATIQLQALKNIFLPSIFILAVGLLFGRSIGCYLSTWGSNWNWQEKLFLLPGNSAKATIQATIGTIPLSQGIAGGEIILAVATLSILITAPLGAWATNAFAPKLLQKGEVDLTKVNVASHTLLLAAVDSSPLAMKVLKKAGDLARQTNGKAIILYVITIHDEYSPEALKVQTHHFLSDIQCEFITTTGNIPEEIIKTANKYGATDVILGKRRSNPCGGRVRLGSVSKTVLETSSIPVILVE
ncbi:Na+/H+-exchanging protein [Richelia intracellularis HH01]|uniref:Na+/H+-exchanging protein n=2 Tax=Richelia TaxID=98443 RepID=M1X330_9NOST|nr:Na+/H+-exchanging protein [Richelia intracellularis HH01]